MNSCFSSIHRSRVKGEKFSQGGDVWHIFLFFLSLYVLSMGGHGYGGVGTTTYDVTRSMLLDRSVAIRPVPWGKFGPDGQFYAQYGIGHSLYNVPFYAIGHIAAQTVPGLASHYDRITMFTTLLGQPVISAFTCVLLFCLCRKLRYSNSISLACTLLYGLGTQVWMYAQLDFSEPILTFLLLAAVYWIHREKNTCEISETLQVWLSGVCLGLAVTVKIVAVIVLPVFLWYLWTSHETVPKARWKTFGAFLIPVLLVGGGIVGTYNVIRFGTPFETGYGNEFTWHIRDVLRHAADNLWGLEGSVFFYSPVIVLAFWGMRDFYTHFTRRSFLVGGIIVTFFLFYLFSTNELYYGPRYLTPTLPFFMLFAASALERLAGSPHNTGWKIVGKWCVGVLLVCGVCQQLVGVIVNYHTYYWRIHYTLPQAEQSVRRSEMGRSLFSTPQTPHILGHVWLIQQGIQDVFEPGGMPVSGVELLSDESRHNAWIPYYGLDLWWCHQKILALGGVKIAVFIVLTCGVMILYSLYRLFTLQRVTGRNVNRWMPAFKRLFPPR